MRYSDAQLYALALFIYSLTPPENPNSVNELSERGREMFEEQGCTLCHTPPLYTSNMLTPVDGFEIPPEHRNELGHLRRPCRDRPAALTQDAPGHRLLQGALVERPLVPRAAGAFRIGSNAGRLVRSGASE